MSESKPNAIEWLRAAWNAHYEGAADKINLLILENALLQQAICNQDANELYIRELEAENAKLRDALKQARLLFNKQGYTMRYFAKCIGITPTQLSAWTDSTPDREPDFRD